jgi:hypothetical protein
VDDEAVLHYCCHRCVGDGVLPLLLLHTTGAKGCMHEMGVHRHHTIARVRLSRRMMMMERVVGVVGDLTGWQWLAGYIPNSVAYSS